MKTKTLVQEKKVKKIQLKKKSISQLWGGGQLEVKTSGGGPTCPISTPIACRGVEA